MSWIGKQPLDLAHDVLAAPEELPTLFWSEGIASSEWVWELMDRFGLRLAAPLVGRDPESPDWSVEDLGEVRLADEDLGFESGDCFLGIVQMLKPKVGSGSRLGRQEVATDLA